MYHKVSDVVIVILCIIAVAAVAVIVVEQRNCKRADINCDGTVDMQDFSILMYEMEQ
jgi:hypothetical protein